MRLEEEIHQTKFRNPRHKLLINLVFTYNWITGHLEEIMKKYDLTLQQYNILRILKGQYPQPASIKLLVERMLDKRCDASRLIERLRLKGLVERNECPVNRRMVDIILTQEGMRILIELSQFENKIDERMSGLTNEEADILNSLLDKLRS